MPPRFVSDPSRSRAKGSVTPEDAPDVIASTEPDDDLSDYIVEPDSDPEGEILPPEPALGLNVPEVLSEASPGKVSITSPLPEQVTTADTELVRQLESELARARARLAGQQADVSSWAVSPAPLDPKAGEVVLIHIRRDGFTANGRVWYRGQELEFVVGEQAWKDTCARDGKSWLLLSDVDQIRRYGEVKFGFGPWPGEAFADDRAAEAERRRGRRAPTITQIAASSSKQVRT